VTSGCGNCDIRERCLSYKGTVFVISGEVLVITGSCVSDVRERCW